MSFQWQMRIGDFARQKVRPWDATRHNRFSGSEKIDGGKSTERLTVLHGNAMFTLEKIIFLFIRIATYFLFQLRFVFPKPVLGNLYWQTVRLCRFRAASWYTDSLATVSTLAQTCFIRIFSNCLSMFAHTRKFIGILIMSPHSSISQFLEIIVIFQPQFALIRHLKKKSSGFRQGV